MHIFDDNSGSTPSNLINDYYQQIQRDIWNRRFRDSININRFVYESDVINAAPILPADFVATEDSPSLVISGETTIKIEDFEITGKELVDLLRSMQNLKSEIEQYKHENKKLRDQIRFLEEI